MNWRKTHSELSSYLVTDELDSQIISRLRAEPEILNSRLSTELSVSNATIGTRLKKLKEAGMLCVVGSTDMRVAGFGAFAWGAVEIAHGNSQEEDKVAQQLASIPEVIAIGSQLHQAQLMFQMMGRDAADLARTIDEKVSTIESVSSIELRVVLATYKRSTDMGPILAPYPNFETRLLELKPTALAKKFNDRELAVLAALHCDGRMSLREVARITNIPESQVRSASKKLSETPGVINFQTAVHPQAVGHRAVSLVYLSVDYRYVSDFVNRLLPFEEVSHLSQISGRHNFVAVINAGSRPQLHGFITERLRTSDIVKSFEVIDLVRGYKFDAAWGEPIIQL